MNLSLAGIFLFFPEMVGGAAAPSPSHQGAAERKWSSNIDSSAESHVGARRQAHLQNMKSLGLGREWGNERRKGREARKQIPLYMLMLHCLMFALIR